MIEGFLMRSERIERLEHENAQKSLEWIGQAKGLVWIRCVKPTSEDIESLAEITKIPLEEFKEAVEENERSKVTVFKHIEIIYRSPTIEDGEIITQPLHVYALGGFIVTIEKHPSKVLSELSAALGENKRRFLFKKPGGYFIYYFLDKVNDEYLHFIDKISIKVIDFKGRTNLTKAEIEKIYDSSIALSYFNQAIIANVEVLNELRKSYYKLFEQEDRQHFADLYSDALQILDTERVQRELLANLFNMQSVITANKLNQFMKGLAFFALMITIPTLITNIYGMNVAHLPLADHPYGFWLILGIMAIITAAIYLIYMRTSET